MKFVLALYVDPLGSVLAAFGRRVNEFILSVPMTRSLVGLRAVHARSRDVKIVEV